MAFKGEGKKRHAGEGKKKGVRPAWHLREREKNARHTPIHNKSLHSSHPAYASPSPLKGEGKNG